MAADLVAARKRVIITTTTTHIAAEQLALAPAHLLLTEATPDRIGAALGQHHHLLITDDLVPNTGKVRRAPLNFVSTARQLGLADAILVEANGCANHLINYDINYDKLIHKTFC